MKDSPPASPKPPERPSRAHLIASGLFFTTYVFVQTLIPSYAAFSDEWFSFVSWTMYTGLQEKPDFTVAYKNGTQEKLEQIQQRLSIGVVVGRKVDTARFVPPHLCEALPDARVVIIRYARSGSEATYPCGP